MYNNSIYVLIYFRAKVYLVYHLKNILTASKISLNRKCLFDIQLLFAFIDFIYLYLIIQNYIKILNLNKYN